MATTHIKTEHGSYDIQTIPGRANIFARRVDPDTKMVARPLIGTVAKAAFRNAWVPQSHRDGEVVTHPAEKTRKAAIGRIISGYEQEARRETTLAKSKAEHPERWSLEGTRYA